VLEAFAPLVAIGQPGEEPPPIGAARAYFSEAEWQPTVVRPIEEATFIAVIAGATGWIRWELGRILEMGRARELLIRVPPYPGDWNWQRNIPAARKSAGRTLSMRSPARVGGPCSARSTCAAWCWCCSGPDGRVLAIRRDGKAMPHADDYQLAIAIALYEQFCHLPD
jgi:hypothetical protein